MTSQTNSIRTNVIDTDSHYGAIIGAPDAATRRQRYIDSLVQPWSQMMSMVAHNTTDDPLAGARGWHWLLPDDLREEPDSLRQLREADAWETCRRALSEAASRFEAFSADIPFDSVEGWLVLADPATSDPIMQGATGAVDWLQPRFIIQFDTPTADNLAHLAGMVAHEFHHLIRLRLFPWDMMNTTVADYIIHEGLAEAFADALYGAPATAFLLELSEDDIQTGRDILRDGLWKTGFNVLRAYIFGDYWSERLNLPLTGMPAYGGYALGYRIVQAYLKQCGKTIEEATFIPAETIVRESGYFDELPVAEQDT